LKSEDCQQILKLCLITGQRLGEVAGIRRSELDLPKAVWNIPASRTKNGHPHTVPLSRMALEIIKASGGEFDKGWAKRMCQVVGTNQFKLDHWTPHDLRRSALTKMAELGVPPIVLGHIANHRTTTKAGVTLGVYVQHQYEREKREALELWASRLQAIVSGSAAKVVAIRRR
jgi:integrase